MIEIDDTVVYRYTYDEVNQLIREDNAYSEQTVTYTYDAGGSMAARNIHPLTLNDDPGESVETFMRQYFFVLSGGFHRKPNYRFSANSR